MGNAQIEPTFFKLGLPLGRGAQPPWRHSTTRCTSRSAGTPIAGRWTDLEQREGGVTCHATSRPNLMRMRMLTLQMNIILGMFIITFITKIFMFIIMVQIFVIETESRCPLACFAHRILNPAMDVQNHYQQFLFNSSKPHDMYIVHALSQH